jgi:hypothetical protein
MTLLPRATIGLDVTTCHFLSLARMVHVTTPCTGHRHTFLWIHVPEMLQLAKTSSLGNLFLALVFRPRAYARFVWMDREDVGKERILGEWEW